MATQIAECLARDKRIPPFDDRQTPALEPKKVLYIDFELDRAQFRQRYAVIGEDGVTLEDKYEMSPNFLRGEDYWDGNMIEGYYSFTDMLLQDFDNRIADHDVQILIIDNLSFLTPGTIANATVAFKLMHQLQKLKKSREISILIVAHTPKSLRHGPLTEQ
ncbi:MAG TPA: AAA family ATPase, partial [Pyrinomonadaceae bacterium]|nr:AAA family ATPase [Pyrinomonadaceae bacterium]